MAAAKEPAKQTQPTPEEPGLAWRIFKKMYRIFSSHLGLFFILVIYSFIGAAIFQALEGPHETQEKYDIVEMRENIISDLWADSQNDTWDQGNWSAHLREALKDYEGQLHTAFAHGINSDSEERVWDFWGSMFFCATIYTTIGYGHIAPATDGGRIATMLYAVIGIPLCLIVMADMGKLMTRGIKYLWAHIRRFITTGSCKPQGKTTPAGEEEPKEGKDVVIVHGYEVDSEFNLPPYVAITIAVAYIFIGAAMYTLWEDWGYLEAFYFIFISVSTIGFGDVLPEHPRFFMLTFLYLLVGLSLIAMVINVIMEVVAAAVDKAKETAIEASKAMGLSVSDLFEEEEEEGSKEKTPEAKKKE
jgi:hypothetical protein